MLIRGLSTESALSEVLDYVESSFYRRKKVIAVSLDCTGAFDCIGFDAVSEALITKEVPRPPTNAQITRRGREVRPPDRHIAEAE